MKNKTESAKRAWDTIHENQYEDELSERADKAVRTKKLSERAKKAWDTRRKNQFIKTS